MVRIILVLIQHLRKYKRYLDGSFEMLKHGVGYAQY